MQVVERLNAKKTRDVEEFLEAQYGFTENVPYVFLLQTKTMKLLLLTEEAVNAPLNLLRVNSQGLYIAEVNEAQNNFRLSIDGTQIIGPNATKNVLELTQGEFDLWVRGNPLPVDESLTERLTDLVGYIIIKNPQGDFFGVANQKDGELMNFIPKARRVQSKLES